MLLLLYKAGCRVVFVDGSFVSRERWPQDFDACFENEGIDADAIDPCFIELRWGRADQKRRFGGEALPVDYPFDYSGLPVREAFTRTRTHERKGLVRLELQIVQTQIIAWLEAAERGEINATNTG